MNYYTNGLEKISIRDGKPDEILINEQMNIHRKYIEKLIWLDIQLSSSFYKFTMKAEKGCTEGFERH